MSEVDRRTWWVTVKVSLEGREGVWLDRMPYTATSAEAAGLRALHDAIAVFWRECAESAISAAWPPYFSVYGFTERQGGDEVYHTRREAPGRLLECLEEDAMRPDLANAARDLGYSDRRAEG